jgi:phosphoglycerate dehydrogenase-like enzyme
VCASKELVHIAIALDTATMRLVERRLQEAFFEVAFLRTEQQLHEHLPAVRFVLADPLPRIDWSRATSLELVHGTGSGIDPLLPAEGLPAGVHIANCRGVHADAVRDHALALLLHFARDLPRAHEQQAARTFRPYRSVPLAGSTLCLVGFGEVGRRIATAARALGMRVRAVRASAAADPVLDDVYGPDALPEAVSAADYTVVCAPLTTRTRGLVGSEVVAAWPFRSVFINVARGAIVDQAALEAALRARRLSGAGLDVFAEEPLPPSSTLWSCPGLLITPHVAHLTPDHLDPVLDLFVENVALVRSGQPPRTAVAREREY